VAIKKTDVKHFSTEEMYNLSREGRLISNLSHPNIIKIYNFYTYENYLYNVMEYAKGGELTQLINSKDEIPETKIKDIFKQIYSAVKYLHNKNIIHRDLKTNNIVFLDEEKTHVAIIDFGISSTSCGGDVLKAGTLKYLPPEILTGDTFKNSNKIDMWALGIILYLLYFKKFPFDGKDFSEIKKRIHYEPVFYPKNIKIRKTLINLIDKLLDKDYNTRISCGDESFIVYFDDNDMNKEAFLINRINNAKSTKKINKYSSSLKASDVKHLLDKIKGNNKK
jgi:serine/threonine protein kinase